MHPLPPRHVFVALTVMWLLALLAEGWLLVDGGTAARAAQRMLTQKRREAEQLGAPNPAPTQAQSTGIEAELTAAGDLLARLQAELADGESAAPHLAGTSEPAESPGGVFPDAGDLVRDLRERARRAGVSIRPEEQFGLAVGRNEAGSPAAVAAHWRQRKATDFLLRALLVAHPSRLVSVQCARPHGLIPGGASARLPQETAAAMTGDRFDFDPRLSVREAGAIETAPIRVTFTGFTATLRQFLNQLSAGSPLVAVSEVAVEPVSPAGLLHRGKSADAEPVVLMVEPALSRFVVTAEFCELAAPPAAGSRRTPAAAVTAGARHPPCVWPAPTLQKRGRGWSYEVFTPPAVFHDRPSGALAAVPPEQAMQANPEDMPSDLQLLQVRKRPFRLRLVGFAGGSEDLRGIFADTATGKTVIGRVGDRLGGRGVLLGHLGLDRPDSGGRGCLVPVATATVTEEATGEEVVLTTRGPSPAGAPWGMFASRKAPALQRELKEGESAVFGGVRYRVERVELEPPLAVVACLPADGAEASFRALIAQSQPVALRGIPALTATENNVRDPPTTP